MSEVDERRLAALGWSAAAAATAAQVAAEWAAREAVYGTPYVEQYVKVLRLVLSSQLVFVCIFNEILSLYIYSIDKKNSNYRHFLSTAGTSAPPPLRLAPG